MSSYHCGQTGQCQLTKHNSRHTGHLPRRKTIMRMCTFRRKMADWLSMEGVLDLCNRGVSEKHPQIFGPQLPVEYVTEFSGRTDVRCDLTDRHTDRTTVTLLHMRRGLKIRDILPKFKGQGEVQ